MLEYVLPCLQLNTALKWAMEQPEIFLVGHGCKLIDLAKVSNILM